MLRRHMEYGAALIEAAIILPFLILLVFGVIDISRAYFDSAKVQEAAVEGAIYASLNPADSGGAHTNTIAVVNGTVASPTFDDVIVSCDSDTQIRVTVEYEFDLITPVLSNIVGDSINLDHSEVARVLSNITVCNDGT